MDGDIETYEEYVPTFDKNHESLKTIVAGIEKTDSDKEDDVEEEKAHEKPDVSYLADVKGVPDFWAKCLKKNLLVQQLIKEKDQAVFDKL